MHDNSITSFMECGFKRHQAEHLSQLASARDSINTKKRERCSKEMFDFYKQRANEISNELDFYWKKYQRENIR